MATTAATTARPNADKPTVICVFCGAYSGNSPAHLAAARALAHIFHKENITLVYGGGTGGIMGELARTLVSLSGPKAVHGVIPTALVKIENGYRTSLTARDGGKAPERVIIMSDDNAQGGAEAGSSMGESEYGLTTLVPDMHTRKRTMAQKVMDGGPGSGFVVLAGGFGTLEEAMEMVTWNQLGIHNCGIVLLNIDGYWDGLLQWVEKSVESGFVSHANKGILVECHSVEEVLGALRGYRLSEERYSLNWTSN
ncbi:lysine decarboxylase-like protein [Histoplasma capsulatum var. duboisii H88]|uniref:Lysine decarboxylase-like protein n=2 Tax=Ajellomyces capsulatus TaxID=5037 RepID=F0UR86_AJEC8|nr:lysine decarboxylase-like protein [Histoplasma capsulatum H143]EGC48413.1 lysine decarboxylase-like protein [Histoplasma capsulatum var. duboisii H88]QSS50432.1 lysine decarboxylase-like protein [Histoplasma capsulatum var. duboisii H88]